MSAITVDGDLVHYEVLGRGRTVILLHGWLGSWHYWIPTMRHLQMKYRVYALDLFGFGDSGKNPEQYSIHKQVYMFEEFMKQLNVPKAGIIAHGLGAHILAKYAQKYPHRVARMMLVSAPLFDPGDLDTRVPMKEEVLRPPKSAKEQTPERDDLPKGRPLASKTSDETIASVSSSDDPAIPRASRDRLTHSTMIDRARLREAALARGLAVMDESRDEDGKRSTQPINLSIKNPLRTALSGGMENLLHKCFKRTDPELEKLQAYIARSDEEVITRSVSGYDAGDMLDTIRRAPVPTVIIHGENDPLIPAPGENVWDYLTLHKEDTLLPIPMSNVGHFPMLESDTFMRLLSSFLETQDISKIEMKERWRRRSR